MGFNRLIVFGIFLVLLTICPSILRVTAATEWSHIYPIGSDAHIRSVSQTSDGGYILGGHTKPASRSDNQALLVKTDSSGIIQWNKTYGGAFTDEVHSVTTTSDGGYIVTGVTGPSSSLGLLWVFKVNSLGDLLWNKTYGGIDNENGWKIIRTSDGGYAVVGLSNNFGVGLGDFWLIKLDAAGTMQWNKAYGTAGNDVAYSVIQTLDDGYAIVGRQKDHQCLLVKTDALGVMQWNSTVGNPSTGSAGYSLIQTSDSGYVVGGFYEPLGGGQANTSDIANRRDFWLAKTDSIGIMQWNKTFGGNQEEIARSVVQIADGGYALAGYTESSGAGTQDVWLIRTDSQGNRVWSQTYGGAGTDVANSLIITSDGGFLLGGNTESFGLASAALLIIKTDGAGMTPPFPDPLTSAWSPEPENVVAATVVATVFTGGVSIVVAAALLPSGLPSEGILQKIRELLPDSLKSWLESWMSSKMKEAIEDRARSPFLPTRGEITVYIVSVLVTGFSFSYVKVDTLPQIATVLPIILSTTILVGFVKTIIITIYSRLRGVWAEYKIWYFGLAMFLATTFLFRVPFSSPSRIVHNDSKKTKRLDAINALAEILISLAFAGGFYVLLLIGYQVIASVGLAMCIIGAFFDSLPIEPLNGKSIFSYSKGLWGIIFAVTLFVYGSWLLLI